MVSKRRPLHTPSSSNMNFRSSTGESSRWETRGTRPTSTPTSVKEILTIMVLHLCKKSIFFDTNLKVAFYLGALFLISLIADFLPVPRTYFARSDNIFNKYFVKFAWGWNLLLLVPFVILTSLTYCCGNIKKVTKEHVSRVVIATCFWFFWTKLFNYIEATYGKCNVRTEHFVTKQNCLKAGHFWNGFDLSGHSFILIYGSLVLIEEARVIIGWESVRENIRNEEHYRSLKDTSLSTNPLRNLNENELVFLKTFYEKFTPYIRGLFIGMTALQILWDVMLVTTMMYYHIMIEKFLGGAFAILTWFFTYRAWYTIPKLLPNLPGEGIFKYSREKLIQSTPLIRKKSNFVITPNGKQIPKFMGMPLFAARQDNEDNINHTDDQGPTSSSRLDR